MKTKERPTAWNPADYLASSKEVAVYLDEAFAENDCSQFSAALGDVARAKGMSEIARKTGLARESLYRALSPEGNPELRTILKVLDALGLRLHVAALDEDEF